LVDVQQQLNEFTPSQSRSSTFLFVAAKHNVIDRVLQGSESKKRGTAAVALIHLETISLGF